MQFNQITYFLRICDTFNFTRAAEICNVSQPSLSSSIKKLEHELGGKLFTRQGHGVTLTDLGVAMRTHLGQIEQSREVANRVATDIINQNTSTVDVGLLCTLSSKSLLSPIGLFGVQYPHIEILVHDVWETRAQELLLSGALDCMVMAHTEDLPDRFVENRLTEEPMVLTMDESHPLCSYQEINFADLEGVRYVDRLRCEFREIFFKEMGTRNLAVNTVMRSEREELVREVVADGIGISIMPQSAALDSGLQVRTINDLSIVRRVSLITVNDREISPAVQTFLQLVSAAYSDELA